MRATMMLVALIIVASLMTTCRVVEGKKSNGGGGSSGNALRKKRIMSEIRDIYRNMISTDTPFNTSREEVGIRLSPVPGNLLEFHFSFTGIEGTAFDGGIYHGRILLHPEYPRKAPAISVLTPTGRWEVGKDICLSASAHHQETWDPLWNLRTLVMGLRGHILTQPREIGAISTPVEHQRKLAIMSREWSCPICGVSHANLVPGANATDRAQKQQTRETQSTIDGLFSGNTLLVGDRRLIDRTRTTMYRVNLDTSTGAAFDTDRLLSGAEAQARSEIIKVTKKYRKMRRAEMNEKREQEERAKLFRSIAAVALSLLTFVVLQLWSNFGQGMAFASGGAGQRKPAPSW
jgi:ubiquitin-protein ligase